MDLKKEIKLSDLVRRPKKKAKAPGVTKPGSATRKRGRKQELVGLKIGASQIAASRVVNNGSGEARAARARPARARRRRRRRSARRPRARDGARPTSSPHEQAAAPRHPARHRHEPHRHAHVRLDGIDDERQLANAVRFRAHEALSIPLDQAVLDYRVVSETRRRVRAVSRRVVLAAAYRSRSTTYVAACRAGRRSSSLGRRPRGLRASARRRPAPRRRDERQLPPSSRLDRTRPHDAGDLGRHHLRLHARPRLGRREARGRDHAGARADGGRGRRAEARARSRRPRLGRRSAPRTRTRGARPASCRSSRGS